MNRPACLEPVRETGILHWATIVVGLVFGIERVCMSDVVSKLPAHPEREAQGVDAGIGIGHAEIRVVDEINAA